MCIRDRYNPEKIRGFCEICRKKMGDEVHHIQPQQQADEHGFIGYHHKNHPANLQNVCFECHDKVHGSQTPVILNTTEAIPLTNPNSVDKKANELPKIQTKQQKTIGSTKKKKTFDAYIMPETP